MTTRQQLLQELDTTSDEMLIPVLEFLRVLKSHPNMGDEFNVVLSQTLALLDEQPSYEEWLASVQSKVRVGLEQIEQGELLDGETVVANLLDKIEEQRNSEAP
ncbi:MAG: hypothetical protein AAGD25_30080 [Cyanobacteria bacterium P01_F01_bin.150]